MGRGGTGPSLSPARSFKNEWRVAGDRLLNCDGPRREDAHSRGSGDGWRAGAAMERGLRGESARSLDMSREAAKELCLGDYWVTETGFRLGRLSVRGCGTSRLALT